MIARKPLQIFLAVQKALFLRELSMRFSVSKTGLFWTFFEPFMQVFVMVLVKMLIFSGSGNFDFAVFLSINFIAYNMFKDIVTKSMGAFQANQGLFVYKQVKPINTIIARVLLDIFMTSIIICIFVFIGWYFEFEFVIDNLMMVGFGFLWLIIFSFSFGLFLAVGNIFYPSIGRIISISMIFLMFGSAIFYTIDMVPVEIREILLYNPLVHFMTMIHGHYFYVLDDTYVDYEYMFFWTIGLLYPALWFYRRLEEKIISL